MAVLFTNNSVINGNFSSPPLITTVRRENYETADLV